MSNALSLFGDVFGGVIEPLLAVVVGGYIVLLIVRSVKGATRG